MNSEEYREKLKHPKWQKKRLKVFERDYFRCVCCKEDNMTLHVHHLSYNDGDPWEIADDCLITLCEKCHTYAHIRTDALRVIRTVKWVYEYRLKD